MVTIGHRAYQWQPRKSERFSVAAAGRRNPNDQNLQLLITLERCAVKSAVYIFPHLMGKKLELFYRSAHIRRPHPCRPALFFTVMPPR